jgi:4'-phosphopantetheinyl transferase
MLELQRPKNRVVVWSWSLDIDPDSLAAAAALLSADETARSLRFDSAQLRRRFVAGRARLRTILGEHVGRDPRALAFVHNPFGKPSLAEAPAVHFSLSHSEDQAILAISETCELGADIERIRAFDHLDLARRFFHPNEVAALERLTSDDTQSRAFFQAWTLKEAIVKALGQGLSIPLDAFEVSLAAPCPSLVSGPDDTPDAWWLHSAVTAADYCWALAVPGGSDVELIQRTV